MEEEFLKRVQKINNSYSSQISDFNFRVVDLATETDGEWFGFHGNNSNAQILTILNQVEGIYWNTFQTRIFVTFQHVFTNATTDPFTAAVTDGTGLLNQLRTEWQNNRAGVERDMVHLFSGRSSASNPLGQVAGIGSVCLNSGNNAYAFSKNYASTFFTTAHEIGHLFGGLHSDGQNCGTTNRTIMCQGLSTNNFIFSAASQNRINNFMNSNNSCINGLIFATNGHNRVCSNRTTAFNLFIASPPNNMTVQWSVSGTLTVISSNAFTVNVRATSSSSATGWITATVSSTNTNDQFTITRNNIPIGPEYKAFTISGPSCVSIGQTEAYSVQAYTSTYNWSASNGTITSGQNSSVAYIRPTTSSGMNITVNGSGGGECGGPNGFASKYFSDCSGSYSLSQETTVFPNPSAGELNIESKGEFIISEMVIMDESSKVKKKVALSNNKANVDVSDLRPGIYLVKFILDGTERVERIILE